MNGDLGKAGKLGCQMFPEPGSHVFNRWIFQPLDLVEVAVVQLVHQRLHGTADLGMIVNPADGRVHLPFNGNLDLKAVTVHFSALVFTRQLGERLGGFETEVFDDAGAHDETI